MMTSNKPTLYLIPVGLSEAPLSDVIPARNFAIVKRLKYFIVENVRSARRFLKRSDPSIDIETLSFYTLNRHTDDKEIANMLLPLVEGNDMGIISEAGCPAIADPGADVVAIAQRKGFDVVPLVGPSSILMSLMASGFNGQSFAFLGYLPIDAAQRAAKLKEIQRNACRYNQTQIFIETPYRNNRLLADIIATLPADTLLCVASDITGSRQSLLTLPLSKWAKRKYDYNKIPTIFLIYHP